MKLVIWDLDETFWKGTISEGEIEPIPENSNLVIALTDRGIVNSICSKNSENVCRAALEQLKVWDEFVFSSISWDPKGERIKSIISEMNLRAANVLFIDDNHGNLMEAKHYCPELMVAYPSIINNLISQVAGGSSNKKDRARYEQYRILQKKVSASKKASSNDEFLKSCNILVTIEKGASENIERIYELIHRTNQLNFTKNRISMDEIRAILSDNAVNTGLVCVKDKYGDYGTIGFFALRDNILLHFAFSCRCLGMGVEQYMYAQLGFPDLPEVAGETAVKLMKNVFPDHLSLVAHETTASDTGRAELEHSATQKILFKGPCDILQVISLIKSSPNISCEVTYNSEKLGEAFGYSHSLTIVNSLAQGYDDSCLFADHQTYGTTLFTQKYDFVFLSLLVDPGMGVYRNKSSGALYAFGDYTNPLTEQCYWAGYCAGTYSPWVKFTEPTLQKISEEYEFIGLISQEMFYQNLCKIRESLYQGTRLYLVTGNEIAYSGNAEMGNVNAHIRAATYNSTIRNFAASRDNTFVFETNDYILSPTDISGHQNHFTREANFRMADGIRKLLADKGDSIVLGTRREIRNYRIKKFLLNLMPKASHPLLVKTYDDIKRALR
ncbi:MAG: hypothetical protein V9G11_05225 [Bifidobacterium adolescentis]